MLDNLHGIVQKQLLVNVEAVPDMMTYLWMLLGIMTGGLNWRIRNGFGEVCIVKHFPRLEWTKNKRRLICSILFMVPLALQTQDWVFMLCFIFLYKGLSSKYLFMYEDVGRIDGSVIGDMYRLALYGGAFTVQFACGMFLMGIPLDKLIILACSGIIGMPLCYLVAWMTMDKLHTTKWIFDITSGRELGQFFYGTMLACILSYVVH